MDSDRPYTIHSPTKITLSEEARYWAREHGISLEQMARYLINRENHLNSITAVLAALTEVLPESRAVPGPCLKPRQTQQSRFKEMTEKRIGPCNIAIAGKNWSRTEIDLRVPFSGWQTGS
jgi:hypothetical protein